MMNFGPQMFCVVPVTNNWAGWQCMFVISLPLPLSCVFFNALCFRRGFGHYMRDSAMVIIWPTRDEDGSYASVTLSQRKAPYETMPTHDPDPPFVATLDISETSVRFS
jgi:hypothetical protein